MELLVNRRWILPLILLALAIVFACGEKMKMPTEVPPTGNLGDTLYLMLNPPWDADHGYSFSRPTCIYFGRDTYLYIADTGNNRILRLDAAGTIRAEYPINNPLSISQDELMRLLVVTGEKKVYKIDVGPGGDGIPRVAFDYDNIPYNDTTRVKHHNMIDPTDRFISITDIPAYDKTYFVAASSDHMNNGRVLWFQGFIDNRENADTLFDRKYSDAVGDTFINPIIITGNGVTTTTFPNSIYAYQLSGATHLIVCQDSGSYPVHDLTFQRQVWDQHWVFNYTHSPSETDLLRRGFFSLPKGATIDAQGNIYVVDSGPDRYAGATKFSKAGVLLKPIDQLYTMINIDDNEGLVYNWVEINPQKGGSGTATGLGLNSSIRVPLGRAFNFFTTNYDSISISSNGWCSFLPLTQLPTSPVIPSANLPNAVISVFGESLDPSVTTSGIYYWRDPATNLFVIQYDNIPNASDTLTKTFELLLNPVDSSIIFQYKSAVAWGDSATVGIESANGSKGLTIHATSLRNGYAVKFRMAVQMKSPGGITYDIYGDRRTVYVADTGNNRILRYKLSTDLEQ
jgi:hypothetical protein